MRQLVVLFCCLIFVGCSHFHVYQPNVEQGNIITEKNINELHVGMTRHQVERIMGTSILKNTFSREQMSYVYAFKSGKTDQMIQKRVILIFRNGSLVKIEKDLDSVKAQ
jgi:outer membrane protein assembly factor BamE (lipoprotein component of BamABCDE complex)